MTHIVIAIMQIEGITEIFLGANQDRDEWQIVA